MHHLTNYQVPELEKMIDAEIAAFFETSRFQNEIKDQVTRVIKAELENGIRQAVQHVFWEEGVRDKLYPKLIKAIVEGIKES